MTLPASPDADAHAVAIFGGLGRFVVAFERVCASMRHCILIAFRREGLRNQGLAQVVVNGKAAAALRETLGAVYAELRDQDESDKAVVSDILARVQTLASLRNTMLHAEWHTNFNYEGASDEFIALAIKHGSGAKTGAFSQLIDVTEAGLSAHVREATELLLLLSRLATCLSQKGYKVSEFVTRPL